MTLHFAVVNEIGHQFHSWHGGSVALASLVLWGKTDIENDLVSAYSISFDCEKQSNMPSVPGEALESRFQERLSSKFPTEDEVAHRSPIGSSALLSLCRFGPSSVARE